MKVYFVVFSIIFNLFCIIHEATVSFNPIVISTWAFTNASVEAWKKLRVGGSALDAVETAGNSCEYEQCDFTVGYGGSPDENGETTLDAMIMDGTNYQVGAVAGLRRIKKAISVAKHVMKYTKHTLLVGSLATDFAVKMGFQQESLQTNYSSSLHKDWIKSKCQPNYWINVHPDPSTSCGPYSISEKMNKVKGNRPTRTNAIYDEHNHDTIGIIAMDKEGNLAAGTSSNGAKFKIPGRVGDSPIPGAGAYADSEIGAAAATGDGDRMMLSLPSFLAVDRMRHGVTPNDAAFLAMAAIIKHSPGVVGAVIALRKDGKYGAACHGMKEFPFTISNKDLGTIIEKIKCVQPKIKEKN